MSHHETQADGSDARLADRMVFFSDAVFAIVLTLLVLELRAPEVRGITDGELWRLTLEEVARPFAAFVISFLLTAVFWAAHIRITRRLRRFDWPTAIANFAFLFSITLVPFAAAYLGAHIANPLALEVYGAIVVLASATQIILWLVVTRDHGRLLGGVTQREFWAGLLSGSAPGLMFLLVIVLTEVGQVTLARLAPVVILPLVILVRRFIARGAKPAA
jgi:uncharacterized membrane protein